MKKQGLIVLALLMGCFLATNSFAAQDRSFTNINSAGMFEDVYDLFKYSPAYLPSFEKATLWTQLSNLYNTSDDLMDGSGVSYLVLGGQINLNNLGYAGLILDWDSDTSPQSVTDHNGESDSGFVSSTDVDYQDTNSDGIIDLRANRAAEVEKMYNYFGNDIYLAYALGLIDGLDTGISIRALWRAYNRSYNPWNSSLSLNEKFEEHTYNIATQQEVSQEIFERSGNMDYGYAEYDITVGARSQSLVTNLDLVANLGMLIQPYGNTYDYTYERTVDSDLSVAGSLFEKITETGIETGSGYYPGTGIGFLLDLRGDYQLNKQINIIGDIEFETVGRGITDAKQDREDLTRNTWMSGSDLYTDETLITGSDIYEGTVSDTEATVRVRGIYQGEGWRLGLGIKGSMDNRTTDRTTETSSSTVVTAAGRPVDTDNSVATSLSGMKSEYKEISNTDSLSFPVGVQIDIFKNFPIYFGAEHQVSVTESSHSNKVTSRTQETTTTVLGDGSSSTTITDIVDEQDAYSDSTVTTNHTTAFYYGLTWWPKENIQIDIKNIHRWDYWRDFELSFTFHF